jgi:hypothetical protein
MSSKNLKIFSEFNTFNNEIQHQLFLWHHYPENKKYSKKLRKFQKKKNMNVSLEINVN